MAGQIPGMNELNQVSAKLQDITQQLDGISQATQRIEFVPRGALNATEQLAAQIDSIGRASKRWADSVGPLLRKNHELRESLRRQYRQITDLNVRLEIHRRNLHEIGQNIDENREEYDRLTETIRELELRYGDLNEEMLENQRLFEETQVPARTLAKLIGKDLVDGMAVLGKTIAKAGFKLFTATLNTLADAFMLVYKWQEQYAKSAGEFNQTLGPSTQLVAGLRTEAFGLSAQFMAMGESWEYGIKEAEGFIKGVGFADQQTQAWMKSMVNFGRIMGMSGQEVGEITKTFRNMGMSMGDVTDNLNTISNAANAAGVDVASFSKDIIGSKNDLASFGKQSKVFITAAGFARKLGVEVKTLVSVMKLTDTFEGAATAAAKLNTVFGTTINSMDLMLEDDPGKRLEMIRSGLIGAGKDAANLSRREVRLIGETMQMSEQEVEGFLKSGQTYTDYMKTKAQEDAKAIQMDKMKQKLMGDTVKTLFSFQNAIRELADMLKTALLPLTDALGITDPNQRQKGWFGFGKVMSGIFQSLANGIGKIASNKNFQNFIRDIGTTITQLFTTLDQYISKGDFAQDFDSFITGMKEMFKDIKWIVSQVAGIFNALKSPFRWILEHIAGITEAFLGLSLAATLFGKAMGMRDLGRALGGLRRGVPLPGQGGVAGGAGGGIAPPAGGGGAAPGGLDLEPSRGGGRYGTAGAANPWEAPRGIGASWRNMQMQSMSAKGFGAGSAMGGGVAGVMGAVGTGMATGGIAGSIIEAMGGAPKSAWGDVGSGLLGALGQAIAGPAGAALGGIIGRSFGDLGNYLFGSMSPSGKGPSAMGLMWQWAKDAFKAEGGPVASSRPYIVGEEGPELLVPATAGTIIPNHALGGSGPMTINVILDGRVIQRSLWNPNNPAGVAAAMGA
jgi:archaellum component FlaC